MKRRRIIYSFISAIIGIVICFLLLQQIDPLEIIHGLKSVVPLFIAMYAMLGVVVYLLRAWRFKILLGNSARIWQLYPVVSVHSMFVNLFPLGTGELVLPYLLKKRNITQGFAEGFPSLILARIFDFVVIGIFFIMATLSINKSLSEYVWILSVVMSLAFLLFLLKYAAGKKEFIFSFLEKKKERSWLKKYPRYVDKVLKILKDILTGFEALKKRNILFLTLFSTVCCRLISYLGVFFLLRGVGLNLTFFEIVFITSFYVLLPLVPVNAFGGFGTTEALLVVLIVSFGYVREAAVIASFQIHLIQLSLAVILGLFGFLHLWIAKKKPAREQISTDNVISLDANR
jgi:glycosyltransferase 2 family protein